MNKEDNSLWVFGYGSLCWNPGFDYGDCVVGHVDGFSRRFWQGNTTHRGTEEKPGRVATLVEDKNDRTYGIAFQLVGEAALDYLQKRECTLGGYITHITTFHPRPTRRKRADSGSNEASASSSSSSSSGSPDRMSPLPDWEAPRKPFPVLLYVATQASRHWMGPAPSGDIAEQVVGCSGATGHNVEYVLRLADWFRLNFPDVMDDHLFTIETHIRFKIKERNLCLRSMMNEAHDEPHQPHPGVPHVEGAAAAIADHDHHEHDHHHHHRPNSFASGVGKKCLRCCKV